MLLPAGPIAYLIISQTRFALAPLEACFDAVFSLGHAGQLLPRGLRDCIGQIIVHFHDLILVAVTGAYHRQQFLVTLLPPMGSGDHTPFDHLDHQRPFRAVADIEAPPGRIVKRLAPGHNALPGARGVTPLPPVLWWRRLQIASRRIRGDRQQRALAHARQATTKPLGTPHLIVPGNPAMRQGGAMGRQHLQRSLVTGAVAAMGLGHTGFVQARLLLGPCFGEE